MVSPAFDNRPAPAAPDDPALDADYAYFVQRVRALTGTDLGSYKAPQMRRRLLALAARHSAPTLRDFARTMEREPTVLTAFQNFFTINVSEFFRDPARWDDLATKVLPRLAESRRGLRVWSAGCSIGAEPYTLAIVLDELYPGQPHTILATDIDETILTRAASGAGYTAADLRNVSSARREKHFRRAENGSWSVVPALKSRVTFRRHDLLRERSERGFDLVVCRNVVIYFTDAAKQDLYGRFHDALRPGGALFVGGTEIVSGARALGLEPWLTSFYIAGTRPAIPARS